MSASAVVVAVFVRLVSCAAIAQIPLDSSRHQWRIQRGAVGRPPPPYLLIFFFKKPLFSV